jgi:cytochrome oxidase Cu insertion factor (SCO1/SenC/PrrC family)
MTVTGRTVVWRRHPIQEGSVIRTPAPSLKMVTLLIAAPFIVAACTSAASDESAAADPAATTPAAAVTAGAPATESADTAAASWLDIELTDVATGEAFTLASLQGEVVAIEPMAIWCTNCKNQNDNVREAYADIEALGVRVISLGVEPNEQPEALAKYAERRDYPWTFAQSPLEFSRALNDLFGPQILSVPSTPLIVLDQNGELFTQEFGFHGPDRLLEIFGEAAA